MSRESISKIKEAETAAEQTVADAKHRAREMTEQATRAGEDACVLADRETAQAMQVTLGEVKGRTEQLSARLDAECAEELVQLRHQVTLRQKMAEKIIVRGFELKCR